MLQYSGIFFLLSMPVTQWYSKSKKTIFQELQTREEGLSAQEIEKRLIAYGENTLPETKTDNYFIIFLRQFQSPLIYILFVAALIVYLTGEITDSIIILTVLVFNAVIGTIQEGKAQNTFVALKRFVETHATVLRNGKELTIEDTNVVPGDIIMLQEGEKVPADARIISANNLEVNESALTGESTPVQKNHRLLRHNNLSSAEQRNMLFKGTHIIRGNAKAVVVATGIHTVIGNISKEISMIDSDTPLKVSIEKLSRAIIIAVVVMNIGIFALGIAYGKSVMEMFATLVSLSVSVVPEGLPVVMTLVLATGVWRMSKRNALVKKLQAVEALGQADTIAVDKTGTITKNEMVVERVYTNGMMFEVSGSGYDPVGMIVHQGKKADLKKHPELLFTGTIAAHCAGARVTRAEKERVWQVVGDPTEAALLIYAKKLGINKAEIEKAAPLVADIPFDHKTKYHATVHQVNGKSMLFAIGAPEAILSKSTTILKNNRTCKLSADDHKELNEVLDKLSRDGLRVVAGATRTVRGTVFSDKNITDLTFVGFFGIKDGLRPEVHDAMEQAKEAGLRIVMITGDYEITAKAIAREAGIYQDGDAVLTGADIDSLSPQAFAERVRRASVFARVSPEQKLSIINAYKANGSIIAMTGDGVNDAPSLVAADLGVGMGRIGTEVAKEASDIVLLDDNFGSIVSAIEEGRSIYKTMRKIILYLFSTNVGEMLTIVGALFLGLPLPILPVQILWLNFVTDGFLVIALAMEPKESGLLHDGVRRNGKNLIDRLMATRMFFMAVPMMIGTLFLFQKHFEVNMEKGWTISLTTLAVFQWFNVWNCRSDKRSIFRTNPFSNKHLVVAMIATVLLHMLVVYHPFFQNTLRTTALTLQEWIMILGVASSILVVEEVRKFLVRNRKT